eukprot:856617_1
MDAEQHEREEAAFGPPSKTMDASEYAQELVYIVSKTIESHLNLVPIPGKRRTLEAKQMITRELERCDEKYDASNDESKKNGMMYYVKVRTEVKEWPWLFVKIYDPPLVTTVSRVQFKGMKKMKEDYKLVTF